MESLSNYTVILKHIMDLSDTCLEGIEHVYMQLKRGEMESTIPLLDDIVTAIFEIEQSIQPFSHLLPEELKSATKPLSNNLNLFVSAYEQKNINKAKEILEQELLDNLKNWHVELNACFSPFVTS